MEDLTTALIEILRNMSMSTFNSTNAPALLGTMLFIIATIAVILFGCYVFSKIAKDK